MHLFVGTRSDNMQDAIRKGLKPRRFTPDQVREIRAAIDRGVRVATLAAVHGVSWQPIWMIGKRRSYGDVR